MMKQIVVLANDSEIAAALARSVPAGITLVLADANVEAPALADLLQAGGSEPRDVAGLPLAVILIGRCTACGRCAEVCRYGAIARKDARYQVLPTACLGCAACMDVCPEEAIALQPLRAGRWFHSSTPYGPLFWGALDAGRENSGRLITALKEAACRWVIERDADCLLVNAPAGAGWPMVAACAGADLALIAIEPTTSALRDLERILAALVRLGTPAAVISVDGDLNPSQAEAISAWCAERGITLKDLAHIWDLLVD